LFCGSVSLETAFRSASCIPSSWRCWAFINQMCLQPSAKHTTLLSHRTAIRGILRVFGHNRACLGLTYRRYWWLCRLQVFGPQLQLTCSRYSASCRGVARSLWSTAAAVVCPTCCAVVLSPAARLNYRCCRCAHAPCCPVFKIILSINLTLLSNVPLCRRCLLIALQRRIGAWMP